MLQRLEIQGVHVTVDENLKKYITRKIGHLDRYMSPQSKQCARAEVQLKESKVKNNSHCIVTITMHLPHQNIVIKERALNMYAAIDIVEVKVKQQLQRYKETHYGGKNRRQLFARFRRQAAF